MKFAQPSKAYFVLKRAMDIVGSAGVLLVLSPLLVLTAVAVKLDSPGPAIFVQRRVGKDGREFTCCKFRSMTASADETAHRDFIERQLSDSGGAGRTVQKLTDDPRITRVGKLLRRTSLDELPQLFNVARGQMSLVGPRPPLPYEVREYDEQQRVKLKVKPGVTGLWQVSGRSTLSYRQMLELDIDYARSRSLWLDIKILAKTIPAVLRFEEAV